MPYADTGLAFIGHQADDEAQLERLHAHLVRPDLPVGIRIDAGRPVKVRSETTLDPPTLTLDLVGYRAEDPRPLEGRQLVRRLEVEEIEKRPVITRVTVHFRRPVNAKVQEDERGLFVSLSPTVSARAPDSKR